jgi:hypothetical protein
MSSSYLTECWMKHPSLWGLFKIPQMVSCFSPSTLRFLQLTGHTQLLEAGAAQPATQRSALLTLPNEVLLKIFEHAGPLEQLFLSLTCKRLLQVASTRLEGVSIPRAPSHRGMCCTAMRDMLRILRPVDSRGRKSTAWAACCDCCCYRPKRKGLLEEGGGAVRCLWQSLLPLLVRP